MDGSDTEGAPAGGTSHRDGPMLFVDSLDDPVLSKDDYHHISKVLREPDGVPIVLCDGAGSWRRASLAARPVTVGAVDMVPAPSLRITVAFALIKGDRPELVVQKLTELGVDEIIPLNTDNGVVRWKGDRAAKQRERFERIAKEASMQCRRTHLPIIGGVRSYEQLIEQTSTVIRCDVGGMRFAEAFDAVVHTRPDRVVLAVGPEGGWSERERRFGGAVAAVGDHILRAETASIAAATLATAARSQRV
ncbi:MAG: 16S rRNA (uracil(1498)-N(3))-methyltransferase [Actinobacteria bacterium]|nr:16S rRNA (uracil(1498)-N(3))-methyltransferase [Actinomycetota bacterium]